MALSVRIQYPGAFYHVMARGNRRQAIFADDDDRRFFLHALAQACGRTGWRVHAWVLMGNHYHLFVETPEANLVEGMRWLQNAYTRRYNTRHKAWGRLFGDRYKAVLVEAGAACYYQALMDYLHLNPVRARLIKPDRGQSVLDYPWSSLAGGYALLPKRRARWLAAEHGFKSLGLSDTVAGRRQMVEHLDRRAVQEAAAKCGVPPMPEEVDARCSHLRRGWYWGTQAFGEALLKRARRVLRTPSARDYRASGAQRAHDQSQAEHWLTEGLKRLQLPRSKLGELKATEPRKAMLARLLWDHTTVSQGWIAEQLHMSSAANVSQVLRRNRHLPLPKKLLILSKDVD